MLTPRPRKLLTAISAAAAFSLFASAAMAVDLEAGAVPAPANPTATVVHKASTVGPTPVLTEPEVAESEAAIFARQNGVSEAVAQRALRVGVALAPVVGRLRELIGEREVLIRKEYLPVTRVIVEISAEVRIPEIDDVVKSAPAPVVVSYVHKPSVEALQRVLKTSTKIWSARFPGVVRTTVDDTDPNRVLIVIREASPLPSVADLRAAAADFPSAVRISVVREKPRDEGVLDSRGGLPLAVQGGATQEASFVDMRLDGSRGWPTALVSGEKRTMSRRVP